MASPGRVAGSDDVWNPHSVLTEPNEVWSSPPPDTWHGFDPHEAEVGRFSSVSPRTYRNRETIVTFYGFIPNAHGAVTIKGIRAPYNMSNKKILNLADETDFAAMLNLDARRGRLLIYTDLIWGKFSDITLGDGGFKPGLIDLDTQWQHLLLKAGVGITVFEIPLSECENGILRGDLSAGFRYMNANETTRIGRAPIPGLLGVLVDKESMDFWEPLLGAHLRADLSRECAFETRVLMGLNGGDATKTSWQVDAFLRFRLSDRYGLWLGYRYEEHGFAKIDRFLEGFEWRGQGPVLGLDIHF